MFEVLVAIAKVHMASQRPYNALLGIPLKQDPTQVEILAKEYNLPELRSSTENWLMYSTAPIRDSCSKVQGTGFFFSTSADKRVILLVTCAHVIEDCYKTWMNSKSRPDYIATIFIHSGDGKGRVKSKGREIKILTDACRRHPKLDLAYIILQDVKQTDAYNVIIQSTFIPDDEDWRKRYGAAEKVLMPGYPHGLMDEMNQLPLLRTGITASHPGVPFDGEPEGRTNIFCYHGDSGAPVFVHRKDQSQPLLLLGIHAEGFDSTCKPNERFEFDDSPGRQFPLGTYVRATALADATTWPTFPMPAEESDEQDDVHQQILSELQQIRQELSRLVLLLAKKPVD